MNETFIAELKEKHGDNLMSLKSKGHEVIVRPPTRQEYNRFRSESLSEKNRTYALENLMRGMVVHPSVSEFNGILEKCPAFCENVSEEVLELAGFEQDVVAKKL